MMKTKYIANLTDVGSAWDYLTSRFVTSLLIVLLLTVALISNIAAQGGGYLYVAEQGSYRIAVYNEELVFQHFIPTGGSAFGLDFLPNGNLVSVGVGDGRRVVIYETSGPVESIFSPVLYSGGWDTHDVKVGASGLLYVGATDRIMEFTTSGTLNRSFPTLGNRAIAVLPGNVLWGAGPELPGIDVFDLDTGNRTSTIQLDSGGLPVTAISYSAATGTVLVCGGYRVYELTLSGALLRNFVGNQTCEYGVTRGPNGDVFSAGVVYFDEYFTYEFHRWDSNGTYLGSPYLQNVWYPGNLVWAGYDNPGPPANHPPVLSSLPTSVNINEGSTYTFTASATDPDGDLVRYFGGGYGGAAIDPVTGVFTWTPSEWNVSSTFYIGARDDDPLMPMDDQEAFTITVNEINSPPILGTIANATVYIGYYSGFTVTASDSDIPANALTFSLVGAPAGASINPTSGLFTWISTNRQRGQHTFIVRVTDNGSPAYIDEQSVTVTVARWH